MVHVADAEYNTSVLWCRHVNQPALNKLPVLGQFVVIKGIIIQFDLVHGEILRIRYSCENPLIMLLVHH